MVHYKLNYFDLRGRGEVARLLMVYGGIEFEDRRWGYPEWPQIKPTSPTGKAPWLEVDGEVLPETVAINRFLARKVGLAGKTEWEEAQVDSIIGTFGDFYTEVWPFLGTALGMQEGDKDKLYKDLFAPAAERIFKYVDKALAKSGSGYLVKSGLSWGDLFIADSIETFKRLAPEFEKTHPNMVEYMKRVYATPQLKEYYASRKESNI